MSLLNRHYPSHQHPNRASIRRSLVGRVAFALLVLASAALIVPTAVLASSQATPKSASLGTLNWGWSTPTTWDPTTSSAGTDVTDLQLVYAALTKLTPGGEPIAGLALSWKYTEHGDAFVMTLRKGVTFTDGTPFDAEAVKLNILRDQTAASLLAPQLTLIQSVTVVSKYVVQLNLSSPEYDYPLLFADKWGEMVSPTAFAANPAGLATQPVGAGPFKLVSYTPSSSATLVRNPKYFDAADFHLAEVNIKVISNTAADLAALESGEVNMVSLYTAQENSAARAAGFVAKTEPNLRVVNIQVNQTLAPLNNPLIREAINYAVDRPVLAETQTFGSGKADDEPFPIGYLAYSPKVANYYTYNPTKAKALLAQAGYPNGNVPLTITSSVPTGGTVDALSEQLQAELSAVGFNATISEIPQSEASQLVYVQHTIAFNPNQLAGRTSPLQMLNVAYSPSGLLNGGRSAAPQMVSALAFATGIPLDRTNWAASLQSATVAAVKYGYNINLYTIPWQMLLAKNVTGLQPYITSQSLQGIEVSS
jgi:peptide/nickel transport system substrate-binding protein